MIVALAKSVKPRRVVEFGINVGRTAKVILDNVLGIESYVGVDVLPGYVTEKEVQRQEVPENPGELVRGDERLKLLVRKNGSHDLEANDIGAVDLAWIDGDHSIRGVVQDTTLALANICRGGIIIWHDDHGMPTVDVRHVMTCLSDFGWKIEHVIDTWISYVRFPKNGFSKATMMDNLAFCGRRQRAA